MARRLSSIVPSLLLGLLVFASPSVAPGHDTPTAARGPVPDFGPHWGLATHVELDGISDALAPSLASALGANLVIEDDTPLPFAFDAGHLIWMRDYAPVYVRNAGGIVMWEPLVERAIRREFHGRATPAQPSELAQRDRPVLAARRLPIVLEGGNLVSTGEWAFLTEAVFSDNGRELDLEDEEDRLLQEAGYAPRTKAEVRAMLSEALSLPKDRVVVLPAMPEEATGHVDLFVLALGPHTVMVPKIDEKVALAIEEPEALAMGWDALVHLDNVAATLQARGLAVHRWPMLPPIKLPNVDEDEEEETSTVFLSPANLVLYDGPAGRLALLPGFDALSIDGRLMANLQRSYEDAWRSSLDGLGYDVAVIDAAELAPYLGLLRCVTAPVPFAPPATLARH